MGRFTKWLFAVDEPVETRDGPFSIGDPALAEWLGLSGQTDAGVSVDENTALGLASYYRGVAIISATIAALPLKTYRRARDDSGNGSRRSWTIPIRRTRRSSGRNWWSPTS